MAILLSHGTVTTIDEGLAFLKRSRPRVRLNRVQRGCLEAYLELRRQAKLG
ncbi:MAG: hypothetical protein NT069_02030 [Planctomycetota bacterium]|nr:hypothetical protein [Planctomycetota bacterium]